MPPSLGNLDNLQMLPVFIIGSTKEECLVQISKLGNLRSELKIKHMENVREPPLLSLELKQLHLLGFSWGNDNEGKFNNQASSSTETAEGN